MYLYSGPYRISEVLSGGRYCLRDLENNILSDTFDASQLRPYRTVVDAEELCPDEYLVEELMSHRGDGPRRRFQVKWRGYARSKATWEPRAELLRRCDDLVHEYEARLPAALTATSRRQQRDSRSSGRADVTPPAGDLSPAPTPPPPNQYESDDVPSTARFARGRWEYGRYVATPRGRSLRWFQPSAFTTDQLDNAHFRQLRTAASAGQADVAAIIHWELAGVL